jgi:hypothetical protein
MLIAEDAADVGRSGYSWDPMANLAEPSNCAPNAPPSRNESLLELLSSRPL